MRRSRRERKRERATLRALTSSALALLGGTAGRATAETAMDHIESTYSYSTYSEDELDASNALPGGNRQRYDIQTHQATLAGPITDWLDMALSVTHEKMSGGSPWYNVADAAGTPIQIMSEPTIEDTRNDLGLNLNYYTERGRLGFSGGYSDENDYTAMSFGTDGELQFNEKNTTLSGGLGFSFDQIDPTLDPENSQLRPTHKEKQSYSGFIGLGQVLNRRSVIQGSFSYNWNKGYLDDPYKEVFRVGGGHFKDDRPGSRHQFAFLLRTTRHVEESESTYHLSYQYYLDTWGVSSHATELSLFQNLGDSIQIVPHVRYYSQSEADFYVPYIPLGRAPLSAQSADYRLSSYGAVSFGLKGEYLFHTPWLTDIQWRANLAVERYLSSADLALTSGSSNAPGLVSFTVYSVGITASF